MSNGPHWQPGHSLTKGEQQLQTQIAYQLAVAQVLRARGHAKPAPASGRPALSLVASTAKTSPGGDLPNEGKEADSPSKISEQSREQDSYVSPSPQERGG
jgi:hypothetical protein